MAFSESFLTELVERNDIVDVVSGYVRLSKKSGSNMFGLCPFHSEKTPSFSVSPDKQIYHCFGCGKGGGVINFIMEIENLGFRDAVEFLARRAGMQMPEEENDKESQKRARMLALNKDAAHFFYEQLYSPAGRPGLEYMQGRRIGRAAATNFGLGFAPDTWDSLRNAMKAKGYTDFELFDAGLVRKGKSGGFYDTFHSRLMFPVIDVRGNVIGFSGRIIGDGEPKYMNSPETLVFNKSRNLFALNLAKKSKSGYIILSEGNIDVVSLHQAGFDSAVASLGTSLTPEQARLISRYKSEVIIAYDNDGAGIKAAQRAIGILEKLDLKVKVLRMSGAKDPDEFIKLKGADAFRNLLEGSEDQVDYRLHAVTAKYDLSADEQKVEFLKEATELVARLPGAVERQVYAMRVASLSGVAAVNQIVFVVQQVIYGVTNGVIVLSSQYWGKQQTAPIRRLVCLGLRLEAALSMLFFAVVSLWPAQCVGLFVTDAAIIAEGVRYLHIEGAFYLGIGWLFLLYGLYRAVGRPGMSVVLTVISLGIRVALKMNNRKILFGIAEAIGHADKMMDITVAIDKLEKIGLDNVKSELLERGLGQEAVDKLQPILELSGDNSQKLTKLREVLAVSETGLKGIEEMETVFGYVQRSGIGLTVELDLSLARGLNYYTGAIFEVKALDFAIGSICGGGRYDDLTGIFGMPNMSGVGISFGADRIYDVMTGLNLFPEEVSFTTRVFFTNLGAEEEAASLELLRSLRDAGVAAEIYPECGKMKKQMEYANRRSIPYVVIIGSQELEAQAATVKDMRSGEQRQVPFAALAADLESRR